MSKLDGILRKISEEVPKFVSTGIVDLGSGMAIASMAVDPAFDPSLSSACYAEVVKSNARALDLLGLGAMTTEDILITTRETYILLRSLGEHHFLDLAITTKGTLGLARAIMKRYEPLLIEALPSI